MIQLNDYTSTGDESYGDRLMKEPNKIRTLLRHMSIRHKLLLITSFAVVLIIFVSIWGLRSAMSTSNKILYEQTANSLGIVSDRIEARLENIMDISLTVAVNKDFQSLLDTVNINPVAAEQAVAKNSIYSQLSRIHQRDIHAISVIPKESGPVIFRYMN